MTKTRSRSRHSRAVVGEYANADADQNVYQKIQTCLCYRKKLRHGKQLNEHDAREVMDKTYGKQQSYATATMLEDRFTLTRNPVSDKGPFRTWLGYSEIVDIQRSGKMGNVFVLSVDSENSHNKYYEVYKCRTEKDAKEFEKIVREAKQNRGGKANGIPIGKEPFNVSLNSHRSISHLEFQTHLDSSDEETGRSTVCELMSPIPLDELSDEDEEPPSPVLQDEHKQNYVRSEPAHSASSSPNFKDAASSPILRTPSLTVRAPSPVVREPSPKVKTSPSPKVALILASEEKSVQITPLRSYSPPPQIREPQMIVREPEMTMRDEPVTAEQSKPIARAPEPAPVVTTVEPTREAVIEAPPPPKPMGSEGVTYIKFDSRTQNPSVSDNGPVYMLSFRNKQSVVMDGHADSNANGTQYESNEYLRNGGRVSFEYAN